MVTILLYFEKKLLVRGGINALTLHSEKRLDSCRELVAAYTRFFLNYKTTNINNLKIKNFMKKIMKGMMLTLTTCIAMASCSTDDSEPSKPTPSQSEKVKYEIKVVENCALTEVHINESHQTLYPIYKEYKQLVEEANKKFGTTKEFEDNGSTNINAKAIAETQAIRSEAENFINPKAEELRKKMATATANASEIEKYTAQLSNGIKIILVKQGFDGGTTIEEKEIKDVLSFNQDKLIVGCKAVSSITLSERIYDDTPTLKEAFPKSVSASVKDFENLLRATNEGNKDVYEQLIISKEEANDKAKLTEIVNKFMSKRIAAAKEWSKTAQEKFLNYFKSYNVPQSELDTAKFEVTIKTIIRPGYSLDVKDIELTESIKFKLTNN